MQIQASTRADSRGKMLQERDEFGVPVLVLFLCTGDLLYRVVPTGTGQSINTFCTEAARAILVIATRPYVYSFPESAATHGNEDYSGKRANNGPFGADRHV